MAPPARTTESLIYEARARIMWGDKPDQVMEWLHENGVGEQISRDIIRTSLIERAKEVRSRGVSEAVVGLLIAAAGGAGIGGMYYIGFMQSRVFALCGLAIAFGAFRLLRGIGWILEGGKTSGSVSNLGDGF